MDFVILNILRVATGECNQCSCTVLLRPCDKCAKDHLITSDCLPR